MQSFPLTLADAKWLIVLCTVFGCEVWYAAEQQQKPPCMFHGSRLFFRFHSDEHDSHFRPVWPAQLARPEKFLEVCTYCNWEWKIDDERVVHGEICECNFMLGPLQLNGWETLLWVFVLGQFPLPLEHRVFTLCMSSSAAKVMVQFGVQEIIGISSGHAGSLEEMKCF